MADPISIVSVVALALSAAKVTKTFIDGIRDAPNIVNTIATDLESLEKILSILMSHLQDPVFKDVQAHDQIVAMLTASLKSCTEESANLQKLLRPFVKPSGEAKLSRWSRLAFKFREEDVRTIQQRLSSARVSLDAGVGVATLIISSRTSGKVEDLGDNQDAIKRRINRLLLERGLDSSSAATSSYAASEVLGSGTVNSVMRWLRRTETVVSDESFHHVTGRSPDMIIGIDFGLGATSVAYTQAPEWQRPTLMTNWPGVIDNIPTKTVKSVLGYDFLTGRPRTWGFLVDPFDENTRIEKYFKMFLDEEEQCGRPNDPTVRQAEDWYVDYMSFLHEHLRQYFTHTVSQWAQKHVEFVFSTPSSWKNSAMMSKMSRLIMAAGFGAEPFHQASITLSDPSALAYYIVPRHKRSGTLLMCDVGEYVANVSAVIMSPDVSQPEPQALTWAEEYMIGLMWIDAQVARHILERLKKIPGPLPGDLTIPAYKMAHNEKLALLRDTYGQGETETLDIAVRVPGTPPHLNVPEADITNGSMTITSNQMKSIYDSQVEKLFAFVDEEMQTLRRDFPSSAEVAYIVLSGALGVSAYVQRRMQIRYNHRILSGQDTAGAVACGLVAYRMDQLKETE